MSTALTTFNPSDVKETVFQPVKMERPRVTEWGGAEKGGFALHSFEVVIELNHYNLCGVRNVFDGLTPPLTGYKLTEAWFAMLSDWADYAQINALYLEQHADHPGSVWIHCEGHGLAAAVRIRVFALMQRI